VSGLRHPADNAAVTGGGDDFTAASHEQWSNVARGWAAEAERRERGPAGRAADWMLEAAALRAGERVLELACGAGDVGLRAAEAVGPGGRVLCTDFAEPMVDLVRERAAERGLGNVEARVVDAQQPELGERFDAILCRLGLMLLPDPGRALRAARGLLAGDGRLALAVWAAPERNRWLTALTDAVMAAVGAPPPEPGAPGPFALADAGRLRELLAGAGFEDVLVEDVEGEVRHPSLEAWWADATDGEGPISAVMRHLRPDQLEAVRRDALAAARPYVADGGEVRFPGALLVARAAG
jgi:SAM-dependent methyltransferase